MISRLLLLSFSVLILPFTAFAAQYTETGSHYYTIIPFHELHQTERLKVIEDSHQVLIKELKKKIPDGKVTRAALQLLIENAADFANLTVELNNYVDEKVQDHSMLQNIYSKNDMIPSAFMLMAGGKFSVNLKIGGGGSATFAVIVVPSKIIKTNKITRRVEEYYSLRAAIAVFPLVNVGGGIGGGAAVRAGLGLVWGDLTDPGDFYGTSIGVSGSLAAGLGQNFKLGALLGLTGIKNIYATGTWQGGPIAEASVHINIGGVVPISDFIKVISLDDAKELDPAEVLEAK